MAPGTGVSARPTREQTRDRVLAAAEAVFAEKGYHAATVDDVAVAAGFTKGAVYSNFATKEEVFLAVIGRQVDRTVALAEEVLRAAPEQRSDVLADRLAGAAVLGPEWFLLEAEFLLYAARNLVARDLIVSRARRTHAQVTEVVARHLADLGVATPVDAAGDISRVLIAVTDGLAQAVTANPAVATDAPRLLAETLDALVAAAGQAQR